MAWASAWTRSTHFDSVSVMRASLPLPRLARKNGAHAGQTAGDAYGQIKAARQRQGLTLDENDLWVAATARALGANLVSSDRDFAQIARLTMEDWTQ